MKTKLLLLLLCVLCGCSGRAFVGNSLAARGGDAGPAGAFDASMIGDAAAIDAAAVDASIDGATRPPLAAHGGHGGTSGGSGSGDSGTPGASPGVSDAAIDSGLAPVVDGGSDARAFDAAPAACVAVSLSRDVWTVSAFSTSQITNAPAQFAIDDQPSTRWQSGVAQGSQAAEWFQVDLGQSVRVRRVALYSQIAADQAQALDLVVSDVPLNLQAPAIASAASAGLNSVEVQCDAVGRFVLLRQTGASSAWWSINDLQVQGCAQ